ncbi:hypothetical protein ACO1G0_05350 [Fusobacterium watanabei]|uniref:hypothetical protein n=1 Tax=Fusobacterium watanabei TaxID=2686067 RepID=UPI003B587EC2
MGQTNKEKKFNSDIEFEQLIRENEKKKGADKLTNQQIADKFHCTEATVRNKKKDIKMQDKIKEKKDDIIFLNYYFADKRDKPCIKDILLGYFHYDKNILSFSTIHSKKLYPNQYMKRNKIKDISEISQARIKLAQYYFYEYILPNHMKNCTAGISYRKFQIYENGNFKFSKKVKKVNSLYESEIKDIFKVKEKSIIQQNYENKDTGYYIAYLLNLIFKALDTKNLDTLKFLNKRYVIKEDAKSSFSFLKSFKFYTEYKEKYPLSEKEILILLSHLTLEIKNMTSLEIIKSFIMRNRDILSDIEKEYINNLKYSNHNEQNKFNKLFNDLNHFKDTNSPEYHKIFIEFSKVADAVGWEDNLAIDKGENTFGYFAFRDKYNQLKNPKTNNLTDIYKGCSIHKILYALLSIDLKDINKNLKVNENNNKIQELFVCYHIPTFLCKYMSKSHFKKLNFCVSKMDLEILNNNITEREYFKKVLGLKKEIPNDYDTFEELLEYIHKLDFKLDGTYNESKEIELTSKENKI